MFAHGNLNRVFMAIGLIIVTYGVYLWMQVEPLDDATVEQRVEAGLKQEMWRMEQVQVQRLARAKEKLPSLPPEEQALLLYQASEPIKLTPAQEQRHRQAIRRDITESHAYRRKKATSMMFLGLALLIMTLTPQLVQQIMERRSGK